MISLKILKKKVEENSRALFSIYQFDFKRTYFKKRQEEKIKSAVNADFLFISACERGAYGRRKLCVFGNEHVYPEVAVE